MSKRHRGRPKLSALELASHGAKLHRIRKREAEELAALQAKLPPVPAPIEAPWPDPSAVAAFVASVERERETFEQRRVATETLTRQHGSGFHWADAGPGYAEHGAISRFPDLNFIAKHAVPPSSLSLLTRCLVFANETINDPLKVDTWASELSTRFLGELESGASSGFYLDVEAVKNVEKMIETFSKKFVGPLRTLALVEFLCWKTSDGEYRFPDEELLNLHEDDIAIVDAGILALQAAT
jgi:hypothetical protein